jgi:hypothetical protein
MRAGAPTKALLAIMVAEYCYSYQAKFRIRNLVPFSSSLDASSLYHLAIPSSVSSYILTSLILCDYFSNPFLHLDLGLAVGRSQLPFTFKTFSEIPSSLIFLNLPAQSYSVIC